jgi:hypothetical protein
MRKLLRWAVRAGVVLGLVGLVAAAFSYWNARQLREEMLAAFTPVQITNCELQRFGAPNDGGYLLCANLLQEARSAYSYGIGGTDDWGCHVSSALSVPVHQYDCFDVRPPACQTANPSPMFHAECIGPRAERLDHRPYDSLASQIQKNGDAGKRLVVKMDVEGSEWESLLSAPDETLQNIDQLAMELHGLEDPMFVQSAQRLTQFFYVANLHVNNFACQEGHDPFPAWVWEVLLVNKRIAQTNGQARTPMSAPPDAPNGAQYPDCQVGPRRSEVLRIAGWSWRKAREIKWLLMD